MASDESMRELERKYVGFKVYDNAGEKIGKVDDLFVDENDREEYLGVKMGLFGMRSTLIPVDVVRVNERDRAIEVAESKDRVKDAPNFDDNEDITPDYEERVRRHFGLEGAETSSSRGPYGRSETAGGETTRDMGSQEDRDSYSSGEQSGGEDRGDRETVGREEYRNREDYGGSGATGAAVGASGAPSDLETGDRDRGEASGEGAQTGDRGATEDEAYRAGYREGFREGFREAEGGGSGGGTSSGGSADREEPMDAGGNAPEGRADDRYSETGGETREGSRRSDEGEQREEGGATKVWRRTRG